MPIFFYVARDERGKKIRGQQVADSPAILSTTLGQNGYQLLSANIYNPLKSSLTDKIQSLQGAPVVQKIFFTQNLGVMLRGGFSISRAMGTLAQQTNHRYFRRVILNLEADLEAGTTFSAALRKHPRVFAELFVNMIAAGEASGKLDEVLKSLTLQMKKEYQLLSKVRGALIYPIVVIVAMVGAGIAMIVFVLPRLTSVFTEAGVKLPLPTRILIGFSDFLQNQWLISIIGVIGLIVVFVMVGRTQRGRRAYDAVTLRLPVAGPITKKVNLARFTRNLSSMLATDIPIIETFHIIGRTLGSVHYRQSVEDSTDALRAGQSISKVLQRYPQLYPPLVQQMVSVGEESGTLDEVAGELATFFEEEVDQTMANLSTILEPVLLLVLGGGVAFMALSIMLPIYNLSSAI